MGDSEPSIEGVAYITNYSKKTLTSIDLATGSKKTFQLEINSSCSALALSPSGDTIISAEWSKGISFNDTSAMTTIHRMDCNGVVWCVAWSADGQYIAAGTRNGEVILIDPSTHAIIKKVKSHHYCAHTVPILQSHIR